MGRRRKKRTAVAPTEEERKTPKSFVLRKGHCSGPLKGLVNNMRMVMMPNTAAKLRERKHNTLKDYQNLCGPLGVSHLMIFTNSAQGNTYLRIVKAPQGPTLTFQVHQYALMKDLAQQQRKPHSPGVEFMHSPLVVMNSFSGKSPQLQLMSTTFQTLFPAINIQKIKLPECKRVLLLDYDKATGMVSFRHYLIQTVPRGVSRSIKRIVQRQNLPNLADYEDISEYVKSTLPRAAESDLDDSDAEVEVEHAPIRKRRQQPNPDAEPVKQQCAVRMHEMGPRMQLQLMKIQEGFCEGTIIYQHEEDKSSSGADKSISKKKLTKEEKQKVREAEMNRIEALAPMVPDKAMRDLKGKRKARFVKPKPGEEVEDDTAAAAPPPPTKMRKLGGSSSTPVVPGTGRKSTRGRGGSRGGRGGRGRGRGRGRGK